MTDRLQDKGQNKMLSLSLSMSVSVSVSPSLSHSLVSVLQEDTRETDNQVRQRMLSQKQRDTSSSHSLLFSSYPCLSLDKQGDKERERERWEQATKKREREGTEKEKGCRLKREREREIQRARTKSHEKQDNGYERSKDCDRHPCSSSCLFLFIFRDIYTQNNRNNILQRDTWVSVRGNENNTLNACVVVSLLRFFEQESSQVHINCQSITVLSLDSWMLLLVPSSVYRVLAYACNGYSFSSLFSRILSFCRWYFLPQLSLQHTSLSLSSSSYGVKRFEKHFADVLPLFIPGDESSSLLYTFRLDLTYIPLSTLQLSSLLSFPL